MSILHPARSGHAAVFTEELLEFA